MTVIVGCNTQDFYIDLGQCLTEKGVIMYGAYWCPHCVDQKNVFGKAFNKIKYVECDPRGKDTQVELCTQMKIEEYPTWIFADGERISGLQQPEVLAGKAGCSLPTVQEANPS